MSKGGTDHFLDVATDASGIINPAQNRILWYPLKNAFLTGKVRIGTPDSVGVNSFATGYESKARGMYSQAMGFKAIANGDYSTAIGKKAVAAGTGSFAFGDEVISNGTNSYSFGQQTIALGKGSFALGTTLAGTKTMAQKDNSFALGLGCNANGIGAISIGTGNLSIADYSFTAGKDATASNTSATAIGQSVIASGIYSTAFGYSTTASGNYSTAFGNSTVASGDYSTSLGFSTSAVGASSIAMGRGSSASGSYNTVIGYDSHTNYNRDNSTAIGFQCYTLSGESFAAGSGTTAGNSGLLYGMAYAIGYKVNATGGSSLCLGIESTASGFGSRAIGDNATASGKYSTSIGLYNSTIGEYSTALGEHTQANTRSEFVVGSGNILSSGSATTWVPTEPLFIVGNSPNTAARSNALTILKNGMVGIGTNTPVYKLHTIGDIYADGGWLRVSGGAGLYFESWGGGWNMSDATWIRAMNNKSVYCTGTIRTDGTLQVGDGTTLNVPNGGNFTYSTNVLFANTSGNVGIGTNAPSYALTVSRSASGSFAASISNSAGTEISHGLRIFAGSSTIAGANFIAFYRPNVTSLKIGSITQNAASSVAYNTSSDLRLKEGIRKTGYTIDDLMKIKVVDFNFIFDESKTNLTGFIAQDMNEIYPSAVTIPVDENDYWSIDYGKVTPLIVKAVQDQQEIIESLSQKNQRLETELKSLKEEINQIKTMLAKGVTE